MLGSLPTPGCPPQARDDMPIFLAAGTNGAGKSSIIEAMMLDAGGEYFNADRLARELCEANAELTLEQANVVVWHEMVRQLELAIDVRGTFVFETTLGGSTIRSHLERAIALGIDVHVWYAGLESVDLHIARVAARVASGGHPIEEIRIRDRFATGPLNLLRLMPSLAYLKVVDNTADASTSDRIEPLVVLEMERSRIRYALDLATAPLWAGPLLTLALALDL